MPRYVFATPPTTRAVADRAMRLVVRRFPELDVERQSMLDADGGVHDMWVCHAPNESHLRRWAVAAGLDVSDVVLDGRPNPVAARVPALSANALGTDLPVDPTERKGAQP